MKLQLQDIPDHEFELMHEAVLRLLSETGVLFEYDEAAKLLKKAGNRVDDNGRVHLEPRFVEAMLELVPADGFTMRGRDESKTLRVAVDSMCFRPSTGTPFILDYATRERREATMADARALVTLTDALAGYDMVNSIVSPRDAPGSKGNLRRFVNAHRHSLKPSDITVMNRVEVEAIARIGAVIRGGERALAEKPLTAVDVAMVSPLRCSHDQVEALLECARWRLPVEVLTSPALGMTGPITLAGSAALANAEMIAALCLVYQLAPGLGVINTTRVSPTDMRTAAYNYGAPELGMGSVLVAACCARYGIPGNLYGLGTVGHFPGAQVSMEKCFSGLLMALGRPHMITGAGILDNAMVTSPEQLVIDNEAISCMKRVRKCIEITEETIGVDMIDAAIAMSGGTDVCLLAEEHTLNYLRAGELMDCGLNQWCSHPQWLEQGRPDLYERAHTRVDEVLASHSVEPFDAAEQKAIDEILADVTD